MLLDLPFGLDDESEVGAVAADTGGKPDREWPGVPEGVRVAGPRAKLGETLLRPRQMVFLLACCQREAAPDLRIARDQRLRAVERLGADFACVIDPHQAGGMTSLLGREPVFRTLFRGIAPFLSHGARQRAQRTIETGDEVVSGQSVTTLSQALVCRKAGLQGRPAIRSTHVPDHTRCKKNGRPEDARMITSNPVVSNLLWYVFRTGAGNQAPDRWACRCRTRQ